jgi:hypothetical protein
MSGRAAVAAALVLFALAGCGGSDGGTLSAAAGEIVELTAVDELRSAFAADEGRARLLLVLAPT